MRVSGFPPMVLSIDTEWVSLRSSPHKNKLYPEGKAGGCGISPEPKLTAAPPSPESQM